MNLEGSMLDVADEVSEIQQKWPRPSDLTITLTEKRNPFSLGFCVSASILPRLLQLFFRGRIVSRLASSPAVACARSSRCRDESVLSTLQLLRQIPPGATRTPIIGSSKHRYAWMLAHMKGRRGKGRVRACDAECQVTAGRLLRLQAVKLQHDEKVFLF